MKQRDKGEGDALERRGAREQRSWSHDTYPEEEEVGVGLDGGELELRAVYADRTDEELRLPELVERSREEEHGQIRPDHTGHVDDELHDVDHEPDRRCQQAADTVQLAREDDGGSLFVELPWSPPRRGQDHERCRAAFET